MVRSRLTFVQCVFSLLLVLMPTFVWAQASAVSGSDREELQGIDDQVQTLKTEVIQINNELSLLEEKLLFPSTTQLSVFVSLQSKPGFRLDSVELTVDSQIVAKYIYTYRELEALQKGGVQRLHTGNVANGTHKVAAIFRGQTAGGNDFEQSGSFSVNKDVKPKFVEIQLDASAGAPKLTFKDW